MTNTNSTSLFILIEIVFKLVDDDSLLKGNKITIYKQIIRSVLYLLNNTHLDMLYTVGQLA
jgi:hypothetical protein